MALRNRLGCVFVATLALCALGACGGSKAQTELDKRCDQLAKACGDSDKHVQKIAGECKQAAAKQTEKKCTAQTTAAYDCYEKELCGKEDKVWALDDLRVLTDRHKKCVAERDAVRDCVGK